MKNFLKKYSLGIAIVLSIAFIAVFLIFLFSRPGGDVYIVSLTGRVGVGVATDTSNVVEAAEGMKLSTDNIIVTGDNSSCVLAYKKDASSKDNFINVGENSQVNIYSKNKEGGYNFFLTYGSLISNMPVNESYNTMVSTKVFNLDVNNAITKVDYDSEDVVGKVYTFDGNPILRVIQSSGNTGSAEKLLKNSVCAVSQQDNGAVGFGCLNVAFSLDSFNAQDLKTMSGIANNWAERVSYGVNEFEQAFQTAADYAEYTSVAPQLTTFETEMVVNSDTYVSTNITTAPFDGGQGVGTQFTSDTQTVPGVTAGTTSAKPALSAESDVYYSEFTRETINDLGQYETYDAPVETEAPVTETSSSRTTLPYNSSVTTRTTTTSRNTASSDKPVTVTSAKPVTTTTTATTKAPVTVDPDTTYAVVFSYIENGEEFWSIQVVRHGEAAIEPEVPYIVGKKFVGWDQDFSCVTRDMTINGIFTDSDEAVETYTVKLYVESKLWKTVEVKHGDDVFLPYMPISTDETLEFCGWSEDLTNITSDITAFAMFITAE